MLLDFGKGKQAFSMGFVKKGLVFASDKGFVFAIFRKNDFCFNYLYFLNWSMKGTIRKIWAMNKQSSIKTKGTMSKLNVRPKTNTKMRVAAKKVREMVIMYFVARVCPGLIRFRRTDIRAGIRTRKKKEEAAG